MVKPRPTQTIFSTKYTLDNILKMIADFFLDHGKPAPIAIRRTRVFLVLSFCGLILFIGFDELKTANRMNAWLATPCKIQSADAESVGGGFSRERPYHLHVQFEYRSNAKTYICTDEPFASTDVASDAYAGRNQYPPGSSNVCYVDPRAPSQAVLHRQSQKQIKCFIAIAALITIALIAFYCIPQIFRYRCSEYRKRSPRRKNVTDLFAGVGLFLGFGGLFIWWTGIPLIELVKARCWPAVQATVLESNLITESGGGEVHLTTYRSDILFNYNVAGRIYYSNCYNPTEGSTLLGSVRNKLIQKYTPGKSVTCFVSPEDPAKATLTTHVSTGVVYGLWPAMLSMLGLLGIILRGDGARLNSILKGKGKFMGIIIAALILSLALAQVFQA